MKGVVESWWSCRTGHRRLLTLWFLLIRARARKIRTQGSTVREELCSGPRPSRMAGEELSRRSRDIRGNQVVSV
ncbi:hypothetical protein BJ170DRAFT_365413 [Xylariales sp. AK1849]|nr:hypothetical protein BJ170DRAFT_365413 [Xylariales sp. AK1849]